MKAREYIGNTPPILSSFTKDGEIYEKGIRNIIKFTSLHINGYYPIGTYGCGSLMFLSERKKTLEIILDEVDNKVPVVAHVGETSTKKVIELAKHAKEAGASGVGAIPPYYSPHLSEEALYTHFSSLIDAVNEEEFPVFVYNNHVYSQNPITPKLLKRLADHGLRGCKDSSFDLVNFFQFQDAVSDYSDFNLIVGTEAIFMGAFDAGAIGAVCGIANIFPEIMAKIYKDYLDDNRELAMETQRLILRIRKITKMGATVPIMHYILKLRGVDAGYSLSLQIEIDEATKGKVKKELEELGLL